MSPRFAITLLGGFGVRRAGTLIELPPGCQRLIALLALSRRPIDRGWVCTNLWPDVPTGNAIKRLRSTLWRLRCYGAEDMLATDPRTVAIAPWVYVDWWRVVDLSFEVLSDLARTRPPDPALVAELVPYLQAGELLDGWSDEWAVHESCGYHAVRSFTLDRLASCLSDWEDHNVASALVGRGASADPLRETAPRMVSVIKRPAVSYPAQSVVTSTPSMWQ